MSAPRQNAVAQVIQTLIVRRAGDLLKSTPAAKKAIAREAKKSAHAAYLEHEKRVPRLRQYSAYTSATPP